MAENDRPFQVGEVVEWVGRGLVRIDGVSHSARYGRSYGGPIVDGPNQGNYALTVFEHELRRIPAQPQQA